MIQKIPEFEGYRLDVIPSIEDARDIIIEDVLEEMPLPVRLDYRPYMGPVKDQGQQGSCSAQTAAQIKEYHEFADLQERLIFSPQFIYNNRENQTSEGMTPKDTMKILQKHGVVLESVYPYGRIEPKSKIKRAYYKLASPFKIKTYAKVRSLVGLKQALVKNGPCYLAVPVYNNTTRMWKARSGDKYQGGHAMTIVGYNEEGFIIRNSWSKNWGNQGHTVFPYSDWGLQWEVWTAIDDDTPDNYRTRAYNRKLSNRMSPSQDASEVMQMTKDFWSISTT